MGQRCHALPYVAPTITKTQLPLLQLAGCRCCLPAVQVVPRHGAGAGRQAAARGVEKVRAAGPASCSNAGMGQWQHLLSRDPVCNLQTARGHLAWVLACSHAPLCSCCSYLPAAWASGSARTTWRSVRTEASGCRWAAGLDGPHTCDPPLHAAACWSCRLGRDQKFIVSPACRSLLLHVTAVCAPPSRPSPHPSGCRFGGPPTPTSAAAQLGGAAGQR